MTKSAPQRKDYLYHYSMTTRWRDNDVYAHVNNAVFYEYVDTVVNHWLIAKAGLVVPSSDLIGLVVRSECDFFRAPCLSRERDGRACRSPARANVRDLRGGALQRRGGTGGCDVAFYPCLCGPANPATGAASWLVCIAAKQIGARLGPVGIIPAGQTGARAGHIMRIAACLIRKIQNRPVIHKQKIKHEAQKGRIARTLAQIF